MSKSLITKKSSKDKVIDTVHNYHILDELKFKITHAKVYIDFIGKSIEELEATLFSIAIGMVPKLNRLLSLLILQNYLPLHSFRNRC